MYFSSPGTKRGEARYYLYFTGRGWAEEQFGINKSTNRQKRFGKGFGRKAKQKGASA
jgi:hypothetical protein